MSNGGHWLTMPQPTLHAGALDKSYFDLSPEEKNALRDHHVFQINNLGFELVFSGAQCIRLGKDILVNVANKNHEIGFQWLQKTLGNIFNFHCLNCVADCHIDSTILPLKPGLWLVRDSKIIKYLPKKFQKWDFIVAPKGNKNIKQKNDNDYFLLSSKYLDMNVLSINSDLLIANSQNPELIEKIENKGITVLPAQNRHGRIFGGGFHCFTLDINRDSNLITY